MLDKVLSSPFVEVILKSLSKSSFQVAAAKKLRRKASRCASIVDFVSLAFSFSLLPGVWRLRPAQAKGEIAALMQILIESRPRVIAEIGTAGGGTLFLF